MTGHTPVGYYDSLDFNSPLSDEGADRLVAQLASDEPTRILDVGCGWAELLLRMLTACPDAVGHGIDHDEALIERAKRNAGNRGLTSRVTFSPALSDERSAVDQPADDEPSDLVINVGAEHVFGTLDDAVEQLFDLVRPGGRLLLGTQFWEHEPNAELLAEMGELPTLTELIDGAVAGGWRPLGLKVSTPEEWDRFEFGYLFDWERIVMAPTDPEEGENSRRAADRHRDNYLRRRGFFGFAFLTLGRPATAP